MIIVMGHMKFAAGDGAKAATLLAEHCVTVMRDEEGCELYSFAFDAGDPDLVRVSERWKDADALAAHGQMEHQKAFGRALRAFTMTDVRIDTWEGEFSRNLIGG